MITQKVNGGRNNMSRIIRFLLFGDGHKHKYETFKYSRLAYEEETFGLKVYECCTVCNKFRAQKVY